MTARTFLIHGLLAGLIAGIFSFFVAYTVGEPPIDAAIALEEAGEPAEPHAHEGEEAGTHSHGDDEATHSHGDEEGGISRSTQKTWGLATATIAIGIALGGIVSLISAGVAGRLGRLSVVGSTALVTVLGFVAYSLVPFLKYPAAPPAVGSGDTIGERTSYYFLFVLVSVVAVVVAVVLARQLAARLGAYRAVVLAALGYVAVVTGVGLAMPAVNEIGDFPADVLWQFRLSSLLTLAALWGSLGIALTWLLHRAPTAARAPSLVQS